MQRDLRPLPDGFTDRLNELARQVGRLTPDWRNPERFYRRRDDLVDALMRMVR